MDPPGIASYSQNKLLKWRIHTGSQANRCQLSLILDFSAVLQFKSLAVHMRNEIKVFAMTTGGDKSLALSAAHSLS